MISRKAIVYWDFCTNSNIRLSFRPVPTLTHRIWQRWSVVIIIPHMFLIMLFIIAAIWISSNDFIISYCTLLKCCKYQSWTVRWISICGNVSNSFVPIEISNLKYVVNPELDKMFKRAYGADTPSVSELEQRTALAFVSTTPVFDQSHPLPENVIAVGGLHIRDPKPLPKVSFCFSSSKKSFNE